MKCSLQKNILPDNSVLSGLVLGSTLGADDLNTTGVAGCGDAHFHLLSQKTRLEVGLHHNLDLQLMLANLMHQWNESER